MTKPPSAAEAEVRDAVVGRLRELLPSARIIHELNVAGTSSNRIDVAAVTTQAIVALEIKSERDKLTRLAEQWEAFGRCSHLVIVAAHRKHFVPHGNEHRRADLPPLVALNHPLFLEGRGQSWRSTHVWEYPRPGPGLYSWDQSWTFDPHRALRKQPRAFDMLNMLWAEELRCECSRHGLPSSSRIARPALIESMVWAMTGREICEAVCRRLRWREFAHADPALEG